MKDKKGFEMTISTVTVLVIALILLAVGIYIVYTKILKPADTTSSFITCKGRGGQQVASCSSCPSPGTCLSLPSDDGSLKPCCLQEVK